MNRRRFGVAVLALVLSALPGFGQLHQDPNPPTGGTGSCNYCSKTACGCSSPPAGYYLSYSCTCSSLQCTQTCSYNPL